MPNVQKVSVALTPEFVALLKEAIETGEYTSASEVIPRCATGKNAALIRTRTRKNCAGSGRTELKAAQAASSRSMRSRKRPGAEPPKQNCEQRKPCLRRTPNRI
jgi:Arc/MetJ-type ribon-helix-helix transcriptional regulator